MKIKYLRIPKSDHENYLHEVGFNIICGVDEVGRGAWAGPLVAAAVILNRKMRGLRDSKLLSSQNRVKLSLKIRRHCDFGIGEVSVAEIEKLKLAKATQLAFKRAIKNLKQKPDFILVDGFKIDSPIASRALIKGDRICASIAAASIIAKVYRDEKMRELDNEIKGYQFAKHKGYGTKLHQAKIKKLGIFKVHRKYYKPFLD